MLSEREIEALLEPFGVRLTGGEMRQLRTYLDLLVRWNRTINLTSLRNPTQCVVRHFGESLMLHHHYEISGRLLDIGSGAGFPGLALKITAPALKATLLEPIAKKRAFLKEVARQCEFEKVEVRRERLEEFRAASNRSFDIITARAVGGLNNVAAHSAALLSESGRLCLWLSRQQARRLTLEGGCAAVRWVETLTVPLRREGVILMGARADVSRGTSAESRG